MTGRFRMAFAAAVLVAGVVVCRGESVDAANNTGEGLSIMSCDELDKRLNDLFFSIMFLDTTCRQLSGLQRQICDRVLNDQRNEWFSLSRSYNRLCL